MEAERSIEAALLRDRWQRGPAYWALLLAVAVAYFAGAKLGLSMAFLARQVSPVWPPTGIALAAVLLLGPRVWPGIALAAFLVNATANEPLPTAAGIALGNTTEALLGAWLLRQGRPFRTSLGGMRDVLGLVGLAAGVSTLVSATIGVTSLCLGNVEPWSRFGALWGVWWLGDAMGALVVAPLLLAWCSPQRARWSPRRAAEIAAVVFAVAAVCALIFVRPSTPSMAAAPALEYAAFPFLVWAALRGGPRGATLVTFATSTVAIAGTLARGGPFAERTAHEGLVLLQSYLGVVALTGLFLAAAIAERDRAEQERAATSLAAERHLREEAAFREATAVELAERAAQLADADRAKDEFLAMLGHELRNPLGAVSNALQVLRGGGAEGKPGARMFEVIERQVGLLTRLVGDLLEVSRITRGEISLRKERLDLRAVVVRAVETAQPWIDEREHRLSIERPPQAMGIDGDPMRLEQVFANLLHNAAKYTEPGGHIAVALERDQDAIVVRVRDDGIGIPAELLPHVFEPFTQGDRSLDRARGGLGIGLTLARRIVELHGGDIEATSEGAGRGSEMIVRLPVGQTEAEQPGEGTPQSAADLEPPADRLQVLIVEDQRDAAESLAELVRLLGYGADVAFDGEAALGVVAARAPDVVLLDLGLPGLDGFAVARRMRQLSGLDGKLIVALTGYGRDEDRARTREAGFDHHLVKPVELRELERLLAEASGRRDAQR